MQPAEIIAGAFRGSQRHLHSLPSLMSRAYTLDMLDALLSHVKVPRNGDIFLTPYQIEVATYSTAALADVENWCAPNTSRALETAKRLAASSDGIIYWIRHMLHLVPGAKRLKLERVTLFECYEIMALTLRNLLRFHSVILNAMVQRPAILEICVLLWTATRRGYSPLYPLGERHGVFPEDDEGAGDSAMHVVYMVTSLNPVDMAAFIMQGTICPPKVFIHRTILRLKSLVQINTLDHLAHLPDNTVETRNLHYLFHIMDDIMKSNKDFYDLFLKGNGPAAVMVPLTAVTLKVARSPNFRTILFGQISPRNLLEYTAYVMNWVTASTSGGSLLSNMKGVMLAGATEVLSEYLGIPGARRPTKQIGPFESILSILISHGVWLRLLPSIYRSISHPTPPDTTVNPRARTLMTTGKVALDRFRKYSSPEKRTPRTCDNLNHRRTSKFRDHGARFSTKQCSNCHFVLYCSKRCQKEDWNARHRRECPHMHQIYLEGKDEENWYSHESRSFHLTLMLDTYEVAMYIWNMHGPPPALGPDAQFMLEGRALLSLDVTDGWLSRATGLDEYIPKTEPFIPSYMKTRFDDMIARFRASDPAAEGEVVTLDAECTEDMGKLRLADVAFRFGAMDFNLLVLMRKRVNESVEAQQQEMEIEAFAAQLDVSSEANYEVQNVLVYFCPHRTVDERAEDTGRCTTGQDTKEWDEVDEHRCTQCEPYTTVA